MLPKQTLKSRNEKKERERKRDFEHWIDELDDQFGKNTPKEQ